MAGCNAALLALGKEPLLFPEETELGAMAAFVSRGTTGKFQPMNANFGIIEWNRIKIKNKKERYEYISSLALNALEDMEIS